MRRLLPALLLLLAAPAAAQVFVPPADNAFCGGALLVTQVQTQVVPGPQGKADYSMTLRNTRGGPVQFRVQVMGDVLGKPVGMQAIPAGGTAVVPLGYQPNTPGRMPLRNEALFNALRLGCLPG